MGTARLLAWLDRFSTWTIEDYAVHGGLALVAAVAVLKLLHLLHRGFLASGGRMLRNRVRNKWRRHGLSQGQLEICRALCLGHHGYRYDGHWLTCGQPLATNHEVAELVEGGFLKIIGDGEDLLGLLPAGRSFLVDNGLEAPRPDRVSALYDFSVSSG